MLRRGVGPSADHALEDKSGNRRLQESSLTFSQQAVSRHSVVHTCPTSCAQACDATALQTAHPLGCVPRSCGLRRSERELWPWPGLRQTFSLEGEASAKSPPWVTPSRDLRITKRW